jgi:L-gulonate 5-dehydrogenase
MRAVVLSSEKTLEHQIRPIPAPNPGQVLIKTRYAGICGSDVHAYHGLQPSLTYPCIMGHELVGTIKAINGKSALVPGQRVVVDPSFRCGRCEWCRQDKENICENLRVLGVHCDGGFAEYFVCDLSMVFPIPDEISDEAAILAEPLSIAIHAADRVCQHTDTVLIIGAGPIGLALLIYLRSRYRKIVVLDLLENRRERAQYYGADAVLKPGGDHTCLEQAVREQLGEYPGVIFDTVSSHTSVQYDELLIKRGGEIIIVGMANAETGFRLLPVLKKELTIRGTRMTGKNAFPQVMDFLRSQNQDIWKQYITQFFPLDQFEEGFILAELHPELSVKVVITCEK